jgi:hypothetical protein
LSETLSFSIRSGGQTGVDRAALDAAIALGLAYEGWCPKGGWAEDFPEPPGLLARYPGLTETPDRDPAQRTEWNGRDSDATLILISHANSFSPGSEFAAKCALRLHKPLQFIDYNEESAARALSAHFARFREAKSLNIAGPRESESPGAHEACLNLLVACLSNP